MRLFCGFILTHFSWGGTISSTEFFLIWLFFFDFYFILVFAFAIFFRGVTGVETLENLTLTFVVLLTLFDNFAEILIQF